MAVMYLLLKNDTTRTLLQFNKKVTLVFSITKVFNSFPLYVRIILINGEVLIIFMS